MDRGGTVWRAYPTDSPGPIDYESPAGKPFWVEKFVWHRTTDSPIEPGAVIHITDADQNHVFRRVWPEDTGSGVTEISLEPRTYFRALKFEEFEEGVLEIVLS